MQGDTWHVVWREPQHLCIYSVGFAQVALVLLQQARTLTEGIEVLSAGFSKHHSTQDTVSAGGTHTSNPSPPPPPPSFRRSL